VVGYLIIAVPDIYLSLLMKEFWKSSSAFGEVRGKSRVALFSGHSVHCDA